MSSPVRLLRDAPLTARNSFGVPARAALLAEVNDARALPGLLAGDGFAGARPLVVGAGSNLLFAGDPDQPVVVLVGDAVTERSNDGAETILRAEAGAQWHDFVMQALARGLGGLENLALIPGTVGAAPIQNIGAYGVEVCERIHAVEAFEPATGRWHRLPAGECAFGYRDSLFKRQPDRFIVTAVEFALSRQPQVRIDYAGLGDALAAAGHAAPTPRQVADAVIEIRRSKLPDPAVLGNAGSFFKNPIVPAGQAEALRAAHPGLPVFPVGPFPADALAHGETPQGPRSKLSAAWLIDDCGWKGHRRGDAGVAATHALVLVNHGSATGAQLLALARDIAASVQERFGVALEPEPRLVGDRW
ncbi:UDP-N-acetylmuramate dehydrogenase [Lysobacter sp. A3-1-A15]|uniref:UDP-N-acetylmuramate dehydrogenase n=1 Tax=Novilysobacter viscosus TaxID=3098602 RepID=UPI002ED963D9